MSEIAAKHLHKEYESTSNSNTGTSAWVGWIGFASILMILEGIFQGIAGLVGIFRSSFYLVANNSAHMLVFSSARAWGWANLIVGAVVLIAGISLISGSTWARVVAVIMAMFAAIASLVSITLYPIWSIIVIALSVIVIYAVVAHGSEMKEF